MIYAWQWAILCGPCVTRVRWNFLSIWRENWRKYETAVWKVCSRPAATFDESHILHNQLQMKLHKAKPVWIRQSPALQFYCYSLHVIISNNMKDENDCYGRVFSADFIHFIIVHDTHIFFCAHSLLVHVIDEHVRIVNSIQPRIGANHSVPLQFNGDNI